MNLRPGVRVREVGTGRDGTVLDAKRPWPWRRALVRWDGARFAQWCPVDALYRQADPEPVRARRRPPYDWERESAPGTSPGRTVSP